MDPGGRDGTAGVERVSVCAAHLSSCQRGDVTKVCDAAQLGGHGHQSSLPASLGTFGQAEADHHGLLVILPAEQIAK